MILTHFPLEPDGWRFDPGRRYVQPGNIGKPSGLWLSDESPGAFGWKAWCEGERFRACRTAFAFEVDESRLLAVKADDPIVRQQHPDWEGLSRRWAGVFVRPHDLPEWPWPCGTWVWGWDCDSACVWDLDCVRVLTRRC